MIQYNKLLERRNHKQGFAYDVGIRITEISEGYAEGEIEILPRHVNPMGTVHGGVIFTLMDTVGGSAAISRGTYVTTSSSHVIYINAARGTSKLRAVAKEIKSGRTLQDIDIEVFDDNDKLIAKSTMVYYRLMPLDWD